MRTAKMGAVLLIFLFAVSYGVPQDFSDFPVQKENYYPLQKGNEWVFQVSAKGQKGEITFKAADIETVGKKKATRLETLNQGVASANEHLTMEKDGLFRHRFNGAPLDPPVCLLKLPFKEGQKWENNLKVNGEDLVMHCKAEEGKVTVPAGKFNVIHVDISFDVNGTKCKTAYWFAKGVGMVKQSFDLGTGEIILELKEFNPAKP